MYEYGSLESVEVISRKGVGEEEKSVERMSQTGI
jgi:hypothetical protein